VAIPLIGCGGDEKESEEMPSTPFASAVPHSGFFDSDGVKIHYETLGEGHPIILVHGIESSIKGNWKGTGWFEILQPIRRVIALDCRGHGLSGKPHEPAAYEGDKMPGDILNLMDHFGIVKADLFGYSMGALLSAALLARHRDRFTSVILGGVGNIFAGLGGDMNRAIVAALRAENASEVTDPIGLAFRLFAESDPDNDLEALATCAGNVGDPVTPADYAGVDIPVLVVKGEDDEVFSGADTAATAAAIPGAKLVTIPGTDHLSVVRDQRFRDAVLAFLKEQ
jgi:pimeloyl-ACP methyl ester carboxylesterase